MQMRRMHNRLLHGPGIVEGLEVSVDENQSGAVVVLPGFALDSFGREIVVDRPVRVDVDQCRAGICFVTLQYAETATAPVPTPNGPGEFTRVTESFVIATATEDPGQDRSTGILALARLIPQDDGLVVDESYCPMRPK